MDTLIASWANSPTPRRDFPSAIPHRSRDQSDGTVDNRPSKNAALYAFLLGL
jgi:hypothetical protein